MKASPKRLLQMREWRRKNPDYDRDYRRRKNPDYNREWRRKNPDYDRDYRRRKNPDYDRAYAQKGLTAVRICKSLGLRWTGKTWR